MPTILKGIQLSDKIEVPTQRTITDAGQMIVPCAFARTGSMNYAASSLVGLKDVKPNEIVTVYRDEADVFDEDSMSTFRSAPLTIGHPKDDDGKNIKLTADNSADLQVGMLEGMPTRDEDLLSGTLVITDQKAIDLIVNDEVSELSAGYTCDLEIIDTEDGTKIYQRNIKANHIAIVPKGRAGGNVRIADAMGSVEEETIELSEAQTVMLKAKAAYDASYEVVMNCARRLDEHRRAAGMYDEAGATDTVVEKGYVDIDVHDAVTAKVDALTDTITALKTDSADKVSTRVSVILAALDATNMVMADFDDKSDLEVKLMVLKDRLPELDLSDRLGGYIDARFDIVCEDDSGNSQMADEMSKAFKKDAKLVADEKSVDIVAEARQKSIERHKNRS